MFVFSVCMCVCLFVVALQVVAVDNPADRPMCVDWKRGRASAVSSPHIGGHGLWRSAMPLSTCGQAELMMAVVVACCCCLLQLAIVAGC